MPEALITRCPNGIWSLRKGHHRVCYQEGPYGLDWEDGREIYFETRNQSKDLRVFFLLQKMMKEVPSMRTNHIISWVFFEPWHGFSTILHEWERFLFTRKWQSFDSRRPRSPTRRLTKPSWRRPITIGRPGVVRWNDIYTFPMKGGLVVRKFAFWLFFLVFEPSEYHKSQVKQVGWMRRVDTRSDGSCFFPYWCWGTMLHLCLL